MAPKPLIDRECPASWSRRRLLALAGAGLGFGALASPLAGAMARGLSDVDGMALPFDPTAGLRTFNYGTVVRGERCPHPGV